MTMDLWMAGFQLALSGTNLLYLVVGALIGLAIGVLPGLGPIFGVALMLPFTFFMPPATAIIFLCSIHAATAYGDSIASILINVPGGPGSVASCWDGYPLAKQGRAGMALGISTFGSMIGGVMGWLSLVLIAPLLTSVALKIGPAEYFALGIIALSLLSIAARGETTKGLVMGGVGLLLSFIGQDPIRGAYRFTFGSLYLEDGVNLIPVTVGLFALSQAMILTEESAQAGEVRKVADSIWRGLKEILRRPLTLIRGGLVGIFMGVMPALGIISASISAYFVEKQFSKEPETFGEGNPAGLLAPETAKNACVVGDLVPTFTLGIPGSATTAILLAALTIQGLKPGPDFFSSGVVPYAVFAGILLAQFTFFILGLILARFFAKIVVVPSALLVPLIVALSVYGTYAFRSNLFDVLAMLLFGLLGFILRKAGYPPACLVLGLVLGSLIERMFHRALLISDGSYSVFVTKPISLVILILTAAFLAWPYLQDTFVKQLKGWIKS